MRVFVLKHKRVEEAALLIRPHLSEAASITLTQKLNAMTVTDRPRSWTRSARCWPPSTSPPRGFTFAIKLVRARADVPAGSISNEIGGLGAKLKSLFQFNDYALIDSAVLRGVEGGRVEYRFGDEYLLDFTIRPAGRRQRAAALAVRALAALERAEAGGRSSRPSTAPRCRSRSTQTLVVGASKEEASKSALILILLAQELPRADAEKGTAGPEGRGEAAVSRVPGQGGLARRLGRRAVGRGRGHRRRAPRDRAAGRPRLRGRAARASRWARGGRHGRAAASRWASS